MANFRNTCVASDSEGKKHTFVLAPWSCGNWPISRAEVFLKWVLVCHSLKIVYNLTYYESGHSSHILPRGKGEVRHSTKTSLVLDFAQSLPQLKITMKQDIHPTYFPEAKVRCACGNTFVVGATKPELRVEICFKCHPFYTGEEKLLDTAGRVEKFTTRRARAIPKAAKKLRVKKSK